MGLSESYGLRRHAWRSASSDDDYDVAADRQEPVRQVHGRRKLLYARPAHSSAELTDNCWPIIEVVNAVK